MTAETPAYTTNTYEHDGATLHVTTYANGERSATIKLNGLEVLISRSEADGLLVVDIITEDLDDGDTIDGDAPKMRVWLNEELINDPEDDGYVPPQNDE